MLQLKLLTNLDLRMKMFSRKCNIMYTVKALHRIYFPSLTLSRLFLLKLYVKRIYWILWSLQEMAIITMNIMHIWWKKGNWLKHPLLSSWVSQRESLLTKHIQALFLSFDDTVPIPSRHAWRIFVINSFVNIYSSNKYLKSSS